MVHLNNILKDNIIIYFRPLSYYSLERVNKFLALSHNYYVEDNYKNIIFYKEEAKTDEEIIRNFERIITDSTDKVIIMDPYIFDSNMELVQRFINTLSYHNAKLEVISGKQSNNPYEFRETEELAAFELLLAKSYQKNVSFLKNKYI